MTDMPIRLLVSDIDGTLVRHDKSLSDANRDAIRGLIADGVAVTLISARPPAGIVWLAEALGISGPLGAFNGGTLFDADGTIRSACRLDAMAATAALAILDRADVTTWVFADGFWFTRDMDNPRIARERIASRLEPILRTDFTGLGDRIDKIVGVSDDHALLADLEAQARAAIGPGATISRSQPYFLDITHRLANKGDGVVALADAMAVDLRHVAAIGDMMNDIPMLERVGLSIAMGQAPAAVHAAADAVTVSNDADGVAEAIARLIRPAGDP